MMTLTLRLMRHGRIRPGSHVRAKVVEVLLPATESTPSGWGLGWGNPALLLLVLVQRSLAQLGCSTFIPHDQTGMKREPHPERIACFASVCSFLELKQRKPIETASR